MTTITTTTTNSTMSTRAFLTAVIAMNNGEAVDIAALADKATAMLEQLDKERKATAERNAKKSSAENEPIIKAILGFLADGKAHLTTEIASAVEVSNSKASAMLRKMLAEETVTQAEVKVKGKGVQKVWAIVK